MNKRLIRVWDLPTRAFHWLLLVLVVAAFVTGINGGGLMAWHGRLGIAIAGLLAFRLVWGLFGSTYARFAHFVRGPGSIAAYLRGEWRGAGHNPLGALSVLALLLVLGFQVVSGLLGNDDIAYNGPLYPWIDKATSDWLTGLHHRNMWVIAALVALHVGVIAYYLRRKRENLVKPMISGMKEVPVPGPEPARGGGPAALLVALAVAAATVWLAAGGVVPPPPPAPAEVPSW